MDAKPDPTASLLAPAADGSSAAMRFPGAAELEHPAYIDEHEVTPETREEKFRGVIVRALPAKPEHGDLHNRLAVLVGTHVAPGYIASTDLLTHTSSGSDFATDVCVRKDGINPDTGYRYLEQIAFEVVHTQTIKNVAERARELVGAGVRRLIAVVVKTRQDKHVREWCDKDGRWIMLKDDDVIDDPTLAKPLRIHEIFDAAAADIAIVKAMEANKNPRILEIKAESFSDGEKKGFSDGLVDQALD